jgi:[pyruvate, water dikinase]-phosphate phosphotransferase / [pyruvate, water dikinase] kinase
MRPSIFFNVHLVSDSTGETLNAVMRAATAQFDNVVPLEHNYYLVRSDRQLDKVLREIESAPGVVWFTVSDHDLRRRLEDFCAERSIPILPVLDPSVHMLSRHLGMASSERVAAQHDMDAEYFRRIDAIHFALAHDDGQGHSRLKQADVIVVGVSRTSKTPTCVYLANRGIMAANVPLVPGIDPPKELLELKDGPLIIGLKISVERLIQIRRQRLKSINEDTETDYTDEDRVKEEVAWANRLYARNDWDVIDVSRRSVEETAASILNKLARRGGTSR